MAEAEKRTDTGLAGQLSRVWRLSAPAILTQIASIVMQYINSAMVGRLGAGMATAKTALRSYRYVKRGA